jgi:ubiquinone/menaquinone biosynthesis C-methylase UbiE
MNAAAVRKPYRGIAMEGAIASWYATNTGRNLAEFRELGKRVATGLPQDAAVLEVAPGPGYLAIEIAKLGRFAVTGLDISHEFVRIARREAERAGTAIDFRQGDAAAMPFPAASFDCVLCRAAFKNFGDPTGALAEMHRVLRPGGSALIVDMRKDATREAIATGVGEMGLGPFGAFVTRFILRQLRRRAYRREDFERMAAASPFGGCEITAQPLGFEVTLRRR